MAGIAVLALSYVLSHFYRSFLAVLSPVLTQELGMTPDQQSTALGAWFVAFALSQFPVGILLDRVGPRLTTALMFAVGGAGGGLLFAAAQGGTVVLIAMVMLGIGCAPILMASVYIFKVSYDAAKFATLMSLFIAVGLLGNILGSSPLAWAMETFGWRGTLVGLAAATGILSISIFVLVSDPVKTGRQGGSKGGYFDILKLAGIWWILPLVAMNYAVSGGLRGIWAGPYLDIIHGMTASGIGQITLWMALALAVGAFCYGPADRIFNTRKWVVVPGATLGLCALLFWALHPAMAVAPVTLALITIGFCSMSYAVLMAHATANIPAHLAGRGVTLVNFFNMGGVGLMQWVTGAVYRSSDQTEAITGFSNVLWVYAAALGTALVFYLFSTDAPPRTRTTVPAASP